MLLSLLVFMMGNGAEEKVFLVIDIDGTVVVQFVLFVVMYIVLKKLLFDPYLQMRQQRSAGIDGVRDEAAVLEKRAATLGADYQQRLQAARAQADDERLKLRNQGLDRERDLLAETRAVAQSRVSSIRQQIAQQVKTAQQTLAAQAQPLARQMVRQVLGREV